ncbi:MAG: hypothetical protein ACFFD2_10475 [Promethearchaeota archaeon]
MVRRLRGVQSIPRAACHYRTGVTPHPPSETTPRPDGSPDFDQFTYKTACLVTVAALPEVNHHFRSE